MRLVIVTTHPIQYQVPLFRALAQRFDLTVVFMMRQTPQGQAEGGFGVPFEWDVPLLEGYHHVFASNIAPQPSPSQRNGIILDGHEALLASLQPEVVMVLGWFPRGYLQVIRWAQQHGVPLVCRGESNLVSGRTPLKRLVKFFYFRHLFGQIRSFATIGQHNHNFYRHYGVPEAKLHLAPYSVDTPFFEAQFRAYRPIVRRPGPWRIGIAGKLIAKKRPLDLVAAVGKSRYRDRIQLVIIGDGPLREQVFTQAESGKVSLDFRGFLNQTQIVPQGYADLDALVLPSGEYETWGLVVNEAMTGGIPVIVSDMVGCAPDLVTEDQTGYRFPSGDVTTLTDQVNNLISRLESNHDFSTAVRQKIVMYSLGQTAAGIESAVEAASASSIRRRYKR